MNAPTAHEAYWECHNNPHVYQYDPTDDGPEVIAINTMRAMFPLGTRSVIVTMEMPQPVADEFITILAAGRLLHA